MVYDDTFQSLANRVEGLATVSLAQQGFRHWRGVVDPSAAAQDLAGLRAMQAEGVLCVWMGASRGTIWGDPYRNWMARVWHDCVHLQLGADFNFYDERDVAMYQAHDTPGLDPVESGAVWADTFGQSEYYERYGEFPSNQIQFVRSYMLSGYRL